MRGDAHDLPKRADVAHRRRRTTGAKSGATGGASTPSRSSKTRRVNRTQASALTNKRGTSGGSGTQGKKPARWGRRIGLGIVFSILAVAIAGMSAFLYLYATLRIPAVDDMALAQTTTVYYSDGSTPMGRFSTVDRKTIDPSTLPDYVAHAVVASEDRTFYTNSGIDFKGILRAVVNNITQGTRQGGSTLTQQYVERYYMGETTTYTGKIKEAVLAVKINREQSKEQIIGNYLNTIYFGRGAYGIEAASQAYFGHPAAQLTLSESALLAGIIPSPSGWDPAVDSDMARDRWQRVLNLMVEDGWISQAEADSASFPDTIDPNTQVDESMNGTNGYLMEHVRSELVASGAFTDEQIRTGGLSIVSTIDQSRQNAAVQAAEYMNGIEGWDPAHMHVALSSMNPENGEIVAEYGGSDYLTRQQNAVTQDIAMAGSVFKPFALLANAREGGSLNETYNGNSPAYFDGLTEPVENDGGYSWGRINLIRATAYSSNTAFVALNEKVGSAATRRAAIDAGIPEDTVGLDDTLLNVLGYAAPRNIDLATSYSTIANGGKKVSAHIIRSVSDSMGNKVYETPVVSEQKFSAEEVSSILPALESVTARGGTAEEVASALSRFESGGKTGTSQEQRSAQFAGFVPGLVSVVSMYQSDDEGSSVPLTNIGGLSQFHGGDWPVDVWVQYMQSATENMTETGFSWRINTRASRLQNQVTPQVESPETQQNQLEEQESPSENEETTTPRNNGNTTDRTENGQTGNDTDNSGSDTNNSGGSGSGNGSGSDNGTGGSNTTG